MSGAVRIDVASLSLAGGHLVNEDAFSVELLRDCYVCALADGQGGRPGGGIAARLTCETCVAEAKGRARPELFRLATWAAIVGAADLAVARDPDAGFCTAVAFCANETAVCGASNGDSALVLLGSGSRKAILTDRQHKNPPVGCSGAAVVSFSAALVPPWTLLVMSDGVWKYAGWDVVLALNASRPAADLIADLHEAAKLRKTGRLQDDFTVVALQCRAA